MDYRKLDPALAAELSGEGDPTRELSVFIHVTPEPGAEEAMAQRLGGPVPAGGVLSRTMTAQQIGELSDEPWVVMIRSARRLQTLPDQTAYE